MYRINTSIPKSDKSYDNDLPFKQIVQRQLRSICPIFLHAGTAAATTLQSVYIRVRDYNNVLFKIINGYDLKCIIYISNATQNVERILTALLASPDIHRKI